ncbi:MAG: N-methylhydantoinase [Solirubrobacteraceae bacterium]
MTTVERKVNPITLEVIRNALPAISDEMSADFERASYNMMIYEVRDYCCALVAPDGDLLSQNVGGVSHFVADLGVVINDAVERYGLDGFSPGDVLITNHQAVSGQHLNNVVIHVPVFVGDRVVCFATVRAHWVDIGGRSTAIGGVADPWMEGLQLDQLKIHEAGVPNETLLSVIRSNIRFPDASLGDLRSQIAACNLGARRVRELYEKYGDDVVEAAIEEIFAAAEQRCRHVVAQIPDGVYEAESLMDDDGVTDDPIQLHARVEVSGSDMTIDLSGCSEQRPGAVNSRTWAAAFVAYKCVTTPQEPLTAGSFRALRVVIPEGNIMMARFPAPMAGWSNILPTTVDTILKALAPAIPDRIPAAHLGFLGGLLLFVARDPATDEPFIASSIEGGGWGGRPHEDGESACVSICQGDVRNAPIESVELRSPVVIEERALRCDSGGAGRWRGGLGVDTRVRTTVEGRWTLWMTGRRRCPPWGLSGGRNGEPGGFLLQTPDSDAFELVNVASHPVAAGTRAVIRTAGGGGWGDPREREPERVLADVRAGLISVEAAERQYGVAVG